MMANDVLVQLQAESVSVWLDSQDKLRITKGAPEALKGLVRQHKEAVAATLKAQRLLAKSGVVKVQLPSGGEALAKKPGPLPDAAVEAIRTLGLDKLPLVHNDAGGKWLPYREWVRQQVRDLSNPLCDPEEVAASRRREQEEEERRKQQRQRRRSRRRRR